VFGNENPTLRSNFTDAELAELDKGMQSVRLEGYMRLSAAGKFCTGSTCYVVIPEPMSCVCNGGRLVGGHNCTCDTSPTTVTANLLQAQKTAKLPSFLQIQYPNERRDFQIECPGPAAVLEVNRDKTFVPGEWALSVASVYSAVQGEWALSIASVYSAVQGEWALSISVASV
jgi:hypothetical protein